MLRGKTHIDSDPRIYRRLLGLLGKSTVKEMSNGCFLSQRMMLFGRDGRPVVELLRDGRVCCRWYPPVSA